MEVVLTADVAANEEMMTVDAAVNEEMMTADAAVKETEMATQTTMDATVDQIFVLNPVLNKDLLCSTKIRAVDVKNLKITVVTDKAAEILIPIKICGKYSRIFFT